MPDGVRLQKWDARTADGWGEMVNGAKAIVNLAGASIARLWTDGGKRVIRDSRLNVGQAVVQAVEAAQIKPQVLIQASGVGYYGDRGDEEIAEGTPPGADDFLARFAVEWEASTAHVEDMGVRRAIIRTGLVLSVDGGVFPLLALPFRLFVGGVIGSGRQWVPWIHSADQVRAIRFLIENDTAAGPFNLVAPHQLTSADLSRAIGRALRRPVYIPIPAFAVRLLLGEMSIIVLEGQRAVPRGLQDLGFRFQFTDIDPALQDLLVNP
jgi:uncharacterized protein (TIGR01777 family)